MFDGHATVTKTASDDLARLFHERGARQIYHEPCARALDEVRARLVAKGLPTAAIDLCISQISLKPKSVDLCNVVCTILDELERTGITVFRDSRDAARLSCHNAHFLLQELEKWLSATLLSGNESLPRPFKAPMIVELARNALESEHEFDFQPPEPAGGELDLQGFISWLVVDPDGKDVHIVYDAQEINRGAGTGPHMEHRYEKVVLHEVGHARTQMIYYLDEIQQGRVPVVSLPQHEQTAWQYAYDVVSCISSLRSRVFRFLNIPDAEWVRP